MTTISYIRQRRPHIYREHGFWCVRHVTRSTEPSLPVTHIEIARNKMAVTHTMRLSALETSARMKADPDWAERGRRYTDALIASMNTPELRATQERIAADIYNQAFTGEGHGESKEEG